jgi:HEAT repeat protein
MRSALAAALLAGCPRPAPPAPAIDDAGLVDAAPEAGDPSSVVRRARASESDDLRARAWSVPTTDAPAAELAEGLADPSPWVQLAVVRALPATGGEEALRRTAGSASVDPYVRAEAALALGGDAGRSALGDGWAEAPMPARLPLAFAALRLGDEAARPVVEGLLSAGELPLEPAFFLALSSRPDPGLAAALATGQARVEEELASTAAAARMRLGDDGAADLLRKGLGAPDEEQRLEILDLLVDVPGPAADALLGRARQDASAFVATYADLALLAREGRESAAFLRASESADWELRQLAVRFAARAAGGSAPGRTLEKVVRAGLIDRSSPVRAEAADAVGRLRLSDAADALRPLLADPSPDVALAAARALLLLEPVR